MSSANISHFQRYVDSMVASQQEQYDEIMSMTQLELDHIRHEEEEEEAEKFSENILFEQLKEDPENFYQFTGFSIADFEAIYNLVEENLSKPHRGRKPKFTPLDQFIIFIHYLRSYPRLESLKPIFHAEPCTLQSIITKNLHSVRPILEEEFIKKKLYSSLIIPTSSDFPDCYFIVDATVQEINRPYYEFEEAAKYFSGKHFIYCLKTQVIINLKGLAIDIVTSIPGSEHDKSIFDKNINFFKGKITSNFEILADKGYQDSGSDLLVTPVKGNFYSLNPEQLTYNEKLGKIRILIENYFGRLKSKFNLMKDKYRGSHANYKDFFITCCALVNFDILNDHPLRQIDYDFFSRERAFLRKRVNQQKAKLLQKKKYQKENRMKLFKKSFLLRSSSSDSSDDF